MFSGLANEQDEMLKELDENNAQATSVVTQAQEKAASMQAQKQEAVNAITMIPKMVGGWGIVWAAGIYWFILRPLLK